MKTGLIYSIICTINHRRYVGLTTQPVSKRWKEHINEAKRNPSTPLHKSIAKYGAHNFRIRIIEDDILEENLPNREIYWIEQFDSYNSGFNQTTGGETSKTIHPNVKQRISDSMTGVSKSPEHINKIRETLLENSHNFTVRGNGRHLARKIKGTNITTGEIIEFESMSAAVTYLGKDKNYTGLISRAIKEKYAALGYIWEKIDDKPVKKSVKGYHKHTGELVHQFDSMSQALIALTGKRSGGIKRSLDNPGKSTWYGCHWYYSED